MAAVSALRIQLELAKHFARVDITVVETMADLEFLAWRRPDLVFLGLKKLCAGHHDLGQATDIWLSDYLDQRGIAYTGSAQAATQLDFDKAEAKAQVQRAGLSTAAFFTAIPGQYTANHSLPLPFPLFIKPLTAGGGTGIGDDSVVRNFSEFQQKLAVIFDSHESSSLVERYLTGREFSVAILEAIDGSGPTLMPIEIITGQNERGDRVLGSRVKHEDNEQVIAVDDRVIKAKVNSLALAVYDLLGGRDLARIDIRLDDAGQAHFLEVNFMPAPGTRYFAGACQITENMSYETVLLRIVDLGLSRSHADTITPTTFESVKVHEPVYLA